MVIRWLSALNALTGSGGLCRSEWARTHVSSVRSRATGDRMLSQPSRIADSLSPTLCVYVRVIRPRIISHSGPVYFYLYQNLFLPVTNDKVFMWSERITKFAEPHAFDRDGIAGASTIFVGRRPGPGYALRIPDIQNAMNAMLGLGRERKHE